MSPEAIRPVNIVVETRAKILEFSRETFKFFPKSCLFIFCIFYLNEEELIQRVCLENI